MKIGMNMLLWTNHVTEEHYGIIEQLKQKGFHGIELPLGDGNQAHYTKIGNHLKTMDLGATCVTSLLEETNIASPDSNIRAAGLDRLKWTIDMADALGASIIGGPIHSAFAHFSGAPPTSDEKKWSVEMLQKAGDYAAQADITLCPEALNRFECYLINTMADLKDLLGKIDHPNVQAMYDTHHANIEEKSQQSAIETISQYLRHVHVSENDRGTPGKGAINWKEVFSALKNCNYSGWITIESFSTIIPEFANSINVWRDYSNSEEVFSEGFDLIKSNWQAI